MRLAVERLEAIFDSLDYHVAIYDREWRYTYLNREAARVLGHAREELLGRCIWEVFPDAVGNQYHRELHEAAATRRIVHSDHFYAPFDRWYENHIYPLDDGVLVLSRDVTEQRRAAEALAQREAMLRLAQRAGGVASFEWDFARGTSRCSPEFFEMFGLPPGDGTITADEWGEYVHPEDRPRMAAHLARALAGSETPSADYRIVTADGRTRWLTYSGQLHRTAAGERRMIGTVVDITDRKATEDALAHANRLKDEFLATLSHELRTPLNVIRGRAAMLGTARDLSSARDAAEVIARNSRMLERLVEDLLDLSRMTRGQIRLDCQPVTLREPVEAALQALQQAADAKHLRVAVDLPPTLPLLWADATRLQQIVWNLLTNAVKFTPDGGAVWVEARASGAAVVLTVRDTGEGLPPAVLPHVFDMFWQAESSATRRHSGLGLGLSIVRRLVELHGGAIHAESAGANRGAAFVVRLPVASAEQLQASSQPHDVVLRSGEGTQT